MKKQLTRIFFAAALAGAVFSEGALSASANSAQMQWGGIDAAGAALSGGSSPIEVERELLTFDIGEFPESYYRSAKEFAEYNARVTAEYTFFNPTEFEVTATLAFPFGALPEYAGTKADRESEAEKYGVYINGEKITAPVRHTLYSDGTDTSKIIDGYAEDSFYSPDMTVYRETYVVSGIDEELGRATVSFVWHSSGKLIANNFNMYAGYELARRSENGDEITLWWLGSLPDSTVWEVYEDTNRTVKAEGSVQLSESEQMSFEEFALTAYDPDSGVSQTDYYNAMVSYLHFASRNGGAMSGVRPEKELRLMRWYQYDMTLGAGERLTNTVTAPMYPRIDEYSKPPVYDYTYLLSPAKTWSKFGSIDITINTPFHMTKSTLDGFSKTEEGYFLSLDGLPDGELEFRMREQTADWFWSDLQAGGTVFAAVSLLFAVLLAVGIVIFVKKFGQANSEE